MSPRAARPSKTRPPAPDDPAVPWRLFLAVPLPDEVRDLVASLTGELAALDWPVRWVSAESAHLTLHFLGETPPERAALLRLALPAVVADQPRFTLRTAGLGVFPHQRRPRVLWLGLYGPTHRLVTLHAAVGAALREMAFPVAAEQFTPHITLGRVRNTGSPTVPLRDLPEHVRAVLRRRGLDAPEAPPARPVPVTEVQLIRSHLSREGARYEPLDSFPLGARS